MTRVPATSTPIDRAKVLLDKISAVYPGRSVHLIGKHRGASVCWSAYVDYRTHMM